MSKDVCKMTHENDLVIKTLHWVFLKSHNLGEIFDMNHYLLLTMLWVVLFIFVC